MNVTCSCSQILLKNGANREHSSFVASLLNWRVMLAYAFFGSMLINITAMSRGLNLKELPVLRHQVICLCLCSPIFLERET